MCHGVLVFPLCLVLHMWCVAQAVLFCMCGTRSVVVHKWYQHAPHVAHSPVAGVGPAPLFTVIPAQRLNPRVILPYLSKCSHLPAWWVALLINCAAVEERTVVNLEGISFALETDAAKDHQPTN